MKKAFVYVAAIISLSVSQPVIGETIFVRQGSSGDGTSWVNAFGQLQPALEAAQDGDEIWAAEGIYKPTKLADPNDPRSTSFQMKSGVGIYGGFSGDETSVSQRDIQKNETILSGNIGAEGDPNDNSYHVFYHPDGTGLDETAILDGFTITEGCADDYDAGPFYHTSSGGGMYNYNCSTTVVNCTFKSNYSVIGGGLYNFSVSSSVIKKTRFSNNTAEVGGGAIYNGIWGRPEGSKLTLIECSFNGNNALISNGGAIDNSFEVTCDIINCLFSDNHSIRYGGAVSNWSNSIVGISNCTFIGNSSDFGGGICGTDSFTTVTNCILRDNLSFSLGDQIHLQGGSRSKMVIAFCNISGCGKSGAEWNTNLGTDGGGNIDVDPMFVEPGHWDDSGTPENILDGTWVGGDYHLMSTGWRWDSARDRWTYDEDTSRCIDAGNPGCSLSDEPFTVPDDPDNIWGENIRVNMGAYGGTDQASIAPHGWSLLGDLTNDGIVNLTDFAAQRNGWLQNQDDLPGDLSRDGMVDIADLSLLAEGWLNTTIWYNN